MGIDVSSSTIGWGVLEIKDKKIIYISSGFIKPIKNENIIIRLVDTKEKLKSIINKYKPTNIGIENIISFMKGASSANTIIMLASFNRMVCVLAYEETKKYPELFNVMSIRHGLKKDKLLPPKEKIPELVSEHLNINFPYVLNNKTQKIKEESFDVADGIAVSLYYSFLITGKIKKK